MNAHIFSLKGTSGAADVIAFGLEAASKMETEEILDDKEAISLETRSVSGSY